MKYLKTLATLFFISAILGAAPITDLTAFAAESSAKPPTQDAKAEDGSEYPGAAPDRKMPDLKPGTWEPLFELGENIYPSVIISTATLKEGFWDDPTHIGEPWGVIGIFVRGDKDNCPLTVEISGGSYIKPSTFTGTLADKNVVYSIYPELNYDYEKLLSVKQTVPETLSFKVIIGDKTAPEKIVRVQVRPVNECVFCFQDSSGNDSDVSFFFAGYVNENHPFINGILKDALALKLVDSFTGYSGDKESITAEINAIWEVLQRRGLRYSAMPASADDDNPYIGTQYVRLLSESINYSQANCVDGSVLMASILRKIGLDVSLVKMPSHMFIAVRMDEEGKEMIFIETTMLGESSLDDAMEEGYDHYSENKSKYDSEKDDDPEYGVINIQNARVIGIMPIKDSSVL